MSGQIRSGIDTVCVDELLPLHGPLIGGFSYLETGFAGLFLGLRRGIQRKYQGLLPAGYVKSETQRRRTIHAFSFVTGNRPIPRNAYALSVWIGEFCKSCRYRKLR